jgi:alpha-glucosidase
VLHLARAALALRRDSAALRRGGLELGDDAPDGVLAYERRAGDDRRLVWVNFAAAPAPLPEGWVVELATAETDDGLPPDAAAVLRPR